MFRHRTTALSRFDIMMTLANSFIKFTVFATFPMAYTRVDEISHFFNLAGFLQNISRELRDSLFIGNLERLFKSHVLYFPIFHL